MNEYISKGDAIFAVSALPLTLDAETTQRAIEAVRHIPAADVVEVVRCKDCKWFGELGCAIKIVDDTDKPQEMDYCSFGEMKPAADVKPVTRAKWKRELWFITCSNCGCTMADKDDEGEWLPTNFCPNCGADMRDGEK